MHAGSACDPVVYFICRIEEGRAAARVAPTLGRIVEHVIRNEDDYREIWTYIDGIPAKWAEKRYDLE